MYDKTNKDVIELSDVENSIDEFLSSLDEGFFKSRKTNRNLYFAVLTGCLRISKESIFTGLNNLKVLTLTDVRFDGYFGFTDSEGKDMLEYYGFTAVDEIRQWSEMLELLILPEQCRMKQT